MNLTAIEWTDFSSNPLKYRDSAGNLVWACVKCASGCQHCYSEALALRYGRGKSFTLPNIKDVRPFVDIAELRKIVNSTKINGEIISGKRCFLGDMTDIFGEWISFDLIDKIFAAMALRPDVTFQILTKRPARMAEYIKDRYKPGSICDAAIVDFGRTLIKTRYKEHSEGTYTTMQGPKWPLQNVWLGTSVAKQSDDDNIRQLLRVPAAVRFLSIEPLLGPVILKEAACPGCGGTGEVPGPYGESTEVCNHNYCPNVLAIDWVIVGGESGKGARPMHPDWARSLRDQCQAAGVPFFFKQGSQANWGKYKDYDYFPDDLKIREFPKVGAA